MAVPFVSVIIPCRNEEKYIKKCLNSILKQDYPKETLEVLVVDGLSEDKTKEFVKEYTAKYPFVKIFENQKKIKAAALNIGIKESKGEIIAFADAHTEYQEDYISKSVNYLREYNADSVGGIIKIPLTQLATLKARAIAISLLSSFGAASSFRLGIEKPRYVDTVFNGCYQREVFNNIGLFNEDLLRSQDLEFNLRLKKAGGKILLVPDIVFYYYPKENLKDFFWHNFKDGIWAILPLKFVKIPFKLRHYLPLIFVSALPWSILPYLPLTLFFSFKIALQEKDIRLFFLMPFAFAARHLGYGLGSAWGIAKLLLSHEKVT